MGIPIQKTKNKMMKIKNKITIVKPKLKFF